MIPKLLRRQIYQEQKEMLLNYVDKKWQSHDLKNFHFMSANLNRMLPSIPQEKHKEIYHSILSYRALQGIDTKFYEHFDGVEDYEQFNMSKIEKDIPAIFVSFHLGSFRSALAFLVKKNLNVVLLIDPLPYKLQKKSILGQFNDMKDAFCSKSNLIIYPADRKDLAIRLLDKTKSGYSVLAFIDGNTGYNGVFNQSHSTRIDFLGQKIYMRKGLAILSYFTKCPIIPMLSVYNKELSPRWKIYDAIYPDYSKTANDFADATVRKLFAIFEKALLQNYKQWEGWLYIHKFMQLDNLKERDHNQSVVRVEDLKVNRLAGLFMQDDKYYVLNKEDYSIIQISESIFEILLKKDDFSNLEDDTLNYFMRKGILV